MRILFYNPTSRSDGYPEPPLGLGYLMSIARKLHFEYDFFDEDHHSKFMQLEELLDQMNPDLYVVTCMTPQYPEMQRAVKKFKERNHLCTVIVGGSHPTALPMETLDENPGIDFICKGEGERTFEEFLTCYRNRAEFSVINGLFYRDNGKIAASSPRSLMPAADLDNYEVDWETIFKHGLYIQKILYSEVPVPVLPIITTRGCPFECAFCDEGNIWERKTRSRSIENVINEVTFLKSSYGVNDFNILDDTFTLDRTRCAEMCERLAPLSIRFRITANTRSVSPEMLKGLKRAGCQMIAYGVESGDDAVLRRMKKNQTVEDVKYAFRITREAGIPSFALCMVGNLGEDFPAVKKTLKLIEEIEPDFYSSSLMTPYPGSYNYTECVKNGWILHHEWERWVPSVMKTKGYTPPSRTDKMTTDEILKAYFYLNRYVLLNRFRNKYGRWFFLKPNFYINEIIPRIRTIGISSFINYLTKLMVRGK